MRRLHTLAALAGLALTAACADAPTAPAAPGTPDAIAAPALAILPAADIPDTVNPFVTIWEDGIDPATGLGYEIIEYPACGDADGNALGSVVLHWRWVSGTVIQTSVYKAKAAAGVRYSVEVPTTTRDKVEVLFTTGATQCLFRASYQPGKTFIDGGRWEKAKTGGRRPRGVGGV